MTHANNYTEFKVAFMENYILNNLTAQFDTPLRYWTSNRAAEVDFILQHETDIIPIEVKSGKNIRGRNIQVYNETLIPSVCLRYSALNLNKSGNMLNIPLFLADKTKTLLSFP